MSGLPSYETRSRLNPATEKQLEDLLIQLKSVVIVGTPYRIYNANLACVFCGCMLGVYVDEAPLCLICDDVKWWSQDVKDKVADIMKEYPEKKKKEGKKEKKERVIPEYGRKLRQVREARGLTTRQLAEKIVGDKGGTMGHTSIVNFELGIRVPSDHVKRQLEQVLGLI